MHFKTAIIGGTFLGLGFGLNHEEDSVLIESSGSLGWEFVDAMNTGKQWSETNSLPAISSKYYSQLKERNILEDDKVHLPALAPLLFQFLKDSKLKFHFLTHIIDIKKDTNGYEITIYNQNGFSKISADQILDTTSSGYRQKELKAKQFIGATIHSADNEVKDFNLSGEGFEVIKGHLLSEAFLKIELQINSSWDVARKKIHEFWVNRPDELSSWELASVASRLDVMPENINGWSKEEFTWLPGIGLENPLLALSKGETIELLAEVVA